MISSSTTACTAPDEREATREPYYKFKVSLLGSVEELKSQFRERVSEATIKARNKRIIGVSIGGLQVPLTVDAAGSRDHDAYLLLWDIACDSRFCALRPMYYRGSAAIIVVLDENSVDQLEDYYAEILERTTAVSLHFVICTRTQSADELLGALFGCVGGEVDLGEFEVNHIRHPHEVIEWVTRKFQAKLARGFPRDHFAISFLDERDLVAERRPVQRPLEYCRPEDTRDRVNPLTRVRVAELEAQLTRWHVPVDPADHAVTIRGEAGTFTVFLRDGATYLTPQKCLSCSRACKIRRYICIVGDSVGWASNPEMGQRELVILSKIVGLQADILPDHVREQIRRACAIPCTSLRRAR